MFYWTKISIDNFQDKVKISSKNIEYLFQQQKKLSENSAKAIINDKFLLLFNENNQLLKIIFKTFLLSNSNFEKISYLKNKKEFYCKKDNQKIFCNYQKITNRPNNLSFQTKITIDKNSSIIIENNLNSFLKSIPINLFNLFVIDKNGKILYSNFIKTNSIFDIFNNELAKSILQNSNKFITNDIYVDTIGNYKLLFLQNKKSLKKYKDITRNISITMLLISFLLSIPFGYFFSKPLYEFYDTLHIKIEEEIEKNREKEQMLMQQNKLASMGEMLGNIAHQWRHPITRISLLIQNLKMANSVGKLNEEYLNRFELKANEQINYMTTTIDDFTNFFKKDKTKQEFYINEIIEETLKLLETRIKNINLIKEFKHNKKIDGYKTEFSQVILNILNNAIDVLNEKNIKNREIIIRILENRLEIEDNGGGIDEKIKNKIFEPYFTTKIESQGTGIGLYMSQIIITKHFNSRIEVDNGVKGAIFRIEFAMEM